MGFISNKEKLIKCATAIAKELGKDGKIIIKTTDTTATTIADENISLSETPEDSCKMKVRTEKKLL